MPSRLLLQQLPPPAPPPPPLPAAEENKHPHRRGALVAVAAASAAATCFLLLFLLVLLLLRRRYRRRRPTLPFSPPPAPARPLRRYSRRSLRRATAGFHPSRLLGRGAASPVYLATFPPSPSSPSLAAVKTRASPHELHLLASLPESPRVVSLLGYSSSSGDGGGQSLSLVFEYMPHGSLQAALFGGDGDRFLDWPRRLSVIRDVARALAFLHGECAPPVVHGDLKPSNVLLDADFRAKLADFGLARFKTPDVLAVAGGGADNDFMSQELGGLEPGDHLSTTTAASVANGGARTDNGKDESSGPASAWGKEWWWKQDGSGELDSKDYVAEWIGSQINCPERSSDWADDVNNDHIKNSPTVTTSPEEDKKQNASDGKLGNANNKKEPAATQMREWWKEEFFEEMSKKGSFDKRPGGGSNKPWLRSISLNNSNNAEQPSGLDLSSFRRSRKRSRRQRGRSAGAGSDTFNNNADLLSRELSSTTSMRGTVCYVAPECGGAGDHDLDQLEKADIYSFGVLVLVILSGRRPLHILSSPMKLERANLVSWCRQLARAGNVLEVVDERLVEGDGYDREQAAMCVHLALLCLQRQPELRPDSADIVKMLDGEMEVPHAPPAVENSPSPRVRPFPRSSRRPAHHTDTATAAAAE